VFGQKAQPSASMAYNLQDVLQQTALPVEEVSRAQLPIRQGREEPHHVINMYVLQKLDAVD
jgi:hypothetical protein